MPASLKSALQPPELLFASVSFTLPAMNPPPNFDQDRVMELKEFFDGLDVPEAVILEQARMDSILGIGRWKRVPDQPNWPADILDPEDGKI
jgi:hypothetical protein